jgi:hypothetical protein
MAGSCEQENKISGSIKSGELLYQLRNGQLIKKDRGVCSKLVS